MSPIRDSSGFTLIEVIVVIAVVTILASLVSPMVFRNVGDAKASAALAQIEILGMALDSYRLDHDRYPSTDEGLEALVSNPTGTERWRGPYLRRDVPLDPWGRQYLYVSPSEHRADLYDLSSLGRDGMPGGEGEDADIVSW